MEEYYITCIGVGGHALLGKWEVKEGFEDSLISTLRDYAETIEVCKGTPWEKTKRDDNVFDASIRYYPCFLFADYGEVTPNNGFDLLDYTYMKFPIHGKILYEGGDTIYLFFDIVESIIDLFNEYYVGCNEEEKERKYQQAINTLKEWLNSRTSKKYRDDLKKEKILNEYRKNKEYEESQKSKDVAGEQTAPVSDVSTTRTNEKPREEKESNYRWEAYEALNAQDKEDIKKAFNIEIGGRETTKKEKILNGFKFLIDKGFEIIPTWNQFYCTFPNHDISKPQYNKIRKDFLSKIESVKLIENLKRGKF